MRSASERERKRLRDHNHVVIVTIAHLTHDPVALLFDRHILTLLVRVLCCDVAVSHASLLCFRAIRTPRLVRQKAVRTTPTLMQTARWSWTSAATL